MASYYCPSCGSMVDDGFSSHKAYCKGFANPAFVQNELIKIEPEKPLLDLEKKPFELPKPLDFPKLPDIKPKFELPLPDILKNEKKWWEK